MSAPALPDGLYRWLIQPVALDAARVPIVIAATSASAAWAKFVAQRFGPLKPDRKDYLITRTVK